MSNMSPQECRFNRGIWLSLESLSRVWAIEYGTIYITSGAIFDRDDDKVRDNDAESRRMTSNAGKKRVAVPSHYYKIILRKDGESFRSIAFFRIQRRHMTLNGLMFVPMQSAKLRTRVNAYPAVPGCHDISRFPSACIFA